MINEQMQNTITLRDAMAPSSLLQWTPVFFMSLEQNGRKP